MAMAGKLAHCASTLDREAALRGMSTKRLCVALQHQQLLPPSPRRMASPAERPCKQRRWKKLQKKVDDVAVAYLCKYRMSVKILCISRHCHKSVVHYFCDESFYDFPFVALWEMRTIRSNSKELLVCHLKDDTLIPKLLAHPSNRMKTAIICSALQEKLSHTLRSLHSAQHTKQEILALSALHLRP